MSMTIIEGMKLKKRLAGKAEDLRTKIKEHCALMENQTPMYPNQKETVSGWLQAHRDVVKFMEKISVAIQKTNLATSVTITLGGKEVTKNVAEWVLRRRELAPMDAAAWKSLGDRGLKDQPYTEKGTTDVKVLKVIRFFDAKDRDAMVDLFVNEPSRIDAKLEIVNATTSLVEEVVIDEDKLLS